MLKEELKGWALSKYNEDTKDQLDYYINEGKCEIGDKAYLYSHSEDEFTELEIIHIIARSTDTKLYGELLQEEDVLLNGEDEYQADTSAEFVADNDCYLVWFKYV